VTTLITAAKETNRNALSSDIFVVYHREVLFQIISGHFRLY